MFRLRPGPNAARLVPRLVPHLAARLAALLATFLAAVAIGGPVADRHAGTPACIDVEVQNVHPAQGQLMVAAYADAESFAKRAVTSLQLTVGAATTMRFPLCGIAGPAVALTLFQDLDANGRLDRNPFGVPSEPWGASGKPAPMAAPTWELSQVPVNGGVIVVKLTLELELPRSRGRLGT